ncbi:type II secretion system protein [Lysinibacillus sp. LZ02]|uniref:type II secretion system protein n=1 Tax=Lysinibacillus sp. LZ02 TaxID=3420668 RepID=UPI003D35FA17
MFQQLKKRIKNEKGLTLVELLAVIVILGIIAAIAVPAIGNIINNSRDKAILSEALNVISGAKIAYMDNQCGNAGNAADKICTGTTELKAHLDGFTDAELANLSVTLDADGKWQLDASSWTSLGTFSKTDAKYAMTGIQTEEAIANRLNGK